MWGQGARVGISVQSKGLGFVEGPVCVTIVSCILSDEKIRWLFVHRLLLGSGTGLWSAVRSEGRVGGKG